MAHGAMDGRCGAAENFSVEWVSCRAVPSLWGRKKAAFCRCLWASRADPVALCGRDDRVAQPQLRPAEAELDRAWRRYDQSPAPAVQVLCLHWPAAGHPVLCTIRGVRIPFDPLIVCSFVVPGRI